MGLRPELLALKLQILKACWIAGCRMLHGPKAVAAGPKTSDPQGLLDCWLECSSRLPGLLAGMLAYLLAGFV